MTEFIIPSQKIENKLAKRGSPWNIALSVSLTEREDFLEIQENSIRQILQQDGSFQELMQGAY